MKRVTLIWIILSSLPAIAQGVKINIPDSIQNLTPQNPKIEFKEQEYDFGSFEPVGRERHIKVALFPFLQHRAAATGNPTRCKQLRLHQTAIL